MKPHPDLFVVHGTRNARELYGCTCRECRPDLHGEHEDNVTYLADFLDRRAKIAQTPA